VVLDPKNRVVLAEAEGEVVKLGHEVKQEAGRLEVVERQKADDLERVDERPKEVHDLSDADLKENREQRAGAEGDHRNLFDGVGEFVRLDDRRQRLRNHAFAAALALKDQVLRRQLDDEGFLFGAEAQVSELREVQLVLEDELVLEDKCEGHVDRLLADLHLEADFEVLFVHFLRKLDLHSSVEVHSDQASHDAAFAFLARSYFGSLSVLFLLFCRLYYYFEAVSFALEFLRSLGLFEVYFEFSF